MEASLFDLVIDYYEQMSHEDIQKAAARYLDPIWPVHPQIKYLLLFKALEKINNEARKNKRLKSIACAANQKAKTYIPTLIGELAREAHITTQQTAHLLIESCFCQTKAGAPYVFAHYLNGVQKVFAPAWRVQDVAANRARLIIQGCDGKITLSPRFLEYMCVQSTRHHYDKALPLFLQKMNKVGCHNVTSNTVRCGYENSARSLH